MASDQEQQNIDFSRSLGAADSKIEGLAERLSRIEQSDNKLREDITTLKERQQAADTLLTTIKDTVSNISNDVRTLLTKSSERDGYFKGVKDSAKVFQWASGILLCALGALVSFLVNKFLA